MERAAVRAGLLISVSLCGFAIHASPPHSGDSASADLGIVASTNRPSVPVGEEVPVSVAVANRGPDVAANVSVRFEPPAGARLTGFNGPDCTAEDGIVTCVVGDLEPHSDGMPLTTRFAGARYILPLTADYYTITTRVMSDTPDPEPRDNNATTTFETFDADAALSLSTSLTPPRSDPGDLLTSVTHVAANQPLPRGTRLILDISLRGATLEGVEEGIWTCTMMPNSGRCTAIAWDGPISPLHLTLRALAEQMGGTVVLRTEARADLEGRSGVRVHEAAAEVYRHIVVSSGDDSGSGSLRAALEEANAHCSPNPCRVVFRLPTETTIVPDSPLPPILADRVVIDGTTSAGPIVIDGQRTGEAIRLFSPCHSGFRGLTLRNFVTPALEHAQVGTCFPPFRSFDTHEIVGNVFEKSLRGIHLMGRATVQSNVIRNNRYSGIWMWSGYGAITDNTIEDNGASGVFIGPFVSFVSVSRNKVARHPHMGFAVAGEARATFTSNSTVDNAGLAIDWGLDGSTPAGASGRHHDDPPLLLVATYDQERDVTSVLVQLTPLPEGQFLARTIEFFENANETGQGETPVHTHTAWVTPQGSFVANIPGRAGPWINATVTPFTFFSRSPVVQADDDSFSSTSEFSNSVLVQ